MNHQRKFEKGSEKYKRPPFLSPRKTRLQVFGTECSENTDIELTKPLGVDNLLGNDTIASDQHLVDVERGLDWVGLVVDPLEFFQSTALGLDTVLGGKSVRQMIKQSKRAIFV